MKNSYIFSLKYAAGLYKEFMLLNKLFNENGYISQVLISKGYKDHSAKLNSKEFYVCNGINNKGMILDLLQFPKIILNIFKAIKRSGKNEEKLFLFYNPHPINSIIQFFLYFIPNSKIVTVLHEPFKTIEDRLEYGLKGFIYFSIVNFFQYLSIRLSNKLIVMSPFGRNIFMKQFPNYKDKLIESSLLIEDDGLLNNNNGNRKYFSFIGSVNKGKGIDDFISSINYLLESEIIKYNFLIITASNIDKYIIKFNKNYREILTIINKNNITDDEINHIIKSSKAVFILHQTASQSGVLPLCCKYSTPVIARDIEAFRQYYNNNGVLLSEKFKSKELIEACDKIENNFRKNSSNSLEVFKNNFSENNFSKFYKELL
jgi:glycosyltransferase involved in cell wall biosynthesis